MKITKMPGFGNFGSIVDDFNWSDPDAYKELKDLNLNTLVTVVRGNGNDNFKSLARNAYNVFQPRNHKSKWLLKYGDDWLSKLSPSEIRSLKSIETWVAGLEDYIGWSRVTGKKNAQGQDTGAFGTTELLWHTDDPGLTIFYPLVVLYGAEHMHTSKTCVLQTVDWYDSISESFRSELNELVAVYDMSKTQYGIDQANRDIILTTNTPHYMPLVVMSPGGYTGIRYGVQITGFKDMSAGDSDRILKKINAEIFDPKYQFDYHWDHPQGDLMLIDNSVTLHQRLIRPGHNIEQELGTRVLNRALCDYTDLATYNPFLVEEFASLRRQQIEYLLEKESLHSLGWTRHLAILEKMSMKESVEYINGLLPKDKKFLIEDLKRQRSLNQ